jgi:hypothetical protein
MTTDMKDYVILNSRKRAIIALIHTVAFLVIAIITGMRVVHPLHSGSPAGAWAVAAIYFVVSAVLVILTIASGTLRESLYFACVSASAMFGLARQVIGDPGLHVAVYVRVFMLLCAVALGTIVLREYSPGQQSPAFAGQSPASEPAGD